jgi:hypothetical protein
MCQYCAHHQEDVTGVRKQQVLVNSEAPWAHSPVGKFWSMKEGDQGILVNFDQGMNKHVLQVSEN